MCIYKGQREATGGRRKITKFNSLLKDTGECNWETDVCKLNASISFCLIVEIKKLLSWLSGHMCEFICVQYNERKKPFKMFLMFIFNVCL